MDFFLVISNNVFFIFRQLYQIRVVNTRSQVLPYGVLSEKTHLKVKYEFDTMFIFFRVKLNLLYSP